MPVTIALVCVGAAVVAVSLECEIAALALIGIAVIVARFLT